MLALYDLLTYLEVLVLMFAACVTVDAEQFGVSASCGCVCWEVIQCGTWS